MARFNKRFEVKRETSDAGKIRPDANSNKTANYISPELEKELNSVGFDDTELIQQTIEIEIDKNGNPVIPEGWTFLIHGSSKDRWDQSLLGNDFVVGKETKEDIHVKGRPLCCVEKSDAKFGFERSGRNTAKTYGGKEQSFEIRVLLYKNPQLGEGQIVRDMLNQDEIKDVKKYYMYQSGRHPAVPAGTKLVFLQNGSFDEITNTDGNNILWYIPEKYLEHYLEDMQKGKQNESTEKTVNEDVSKAITITHEDVEKELSKYYSDNVTTPEIEAYLTDKITQIYGDRLEKAGIFDIKKFLDGKLVYFEGVESYRAIIEELESALDFSEKVQNGTIESPKTMQKKPATFSGKLKNAGFSRDTIKELEKSIISVSPKTLVEMDRTLNAEEQRVNKRKGETLIRGGI